jgi:hypothetical protein
MVPATPYIAAILPKQPRFLAFAKVRDYHQGVGNTRPLLRRTSRGALLCFILRAPAARVIVFEVYA